MVRIIFNLSLIDKIGEKELIFEAPPTLKLAEFLIQRGIEEDEIGMVVADGRWRKLEEISVNDYLVIDVFPHLEGG